ncbi:MAG: CHAP domain-containing protein [Oscillospiraceae bacterium]
MAKAQELLQIAAGQIGVREIPADSNRVLYNNWYYGREVSGTSYPWCMTFIQWCANRAELSLLRTASCTALATWAKDNRQWQTEGYRPGDVALFDFSGRRGKTEHVGLVEEIRGDGSLVTIEGNTGAASDANGGEVQRRVRAAALVTGAWRPDYEEESGEMTQAQFNRMADAYLEGLADREPGDWSQEARLWAETNGILTGDSAGRKQYKSYCTREQMAVFLKRMAEKFRL